MDLSQEGERDVTSTVITGIGELVTNDPALPGLLGIVADAAVVVEGGHVAWTGPAADAPAADSQVDAGGRAVLPGFVDSHSHLVFAGDRAQEFAARMTGRPYTAGGIRTTVAATRAATDEQLTAHVAHLVQEMLRQGTTTVEIKSGYGLTVHDEARSLAIARGFTPETTFLGAHVVPEGADPASYVELVTGPMLQAAAPHARWIDAFCETGAFDADQARAVLLAGRAAGLSGRLHANQLGPGPGVRLAAELGLTAVDHCTYLDRTPTSTRSATPAPSRPSCPGWSSRPGTPTRTRAASSTRASRSPSPPTATRAPATPRRCRSASPWRSARCASAPPRRSARRPPGARPPSTARTSAPWSQGFVPTSCCSTPPATCTWPTGPVSPSSRGSGRRADRSSDAV